MVKQKRKLLVEKEFRSLGTQNNIQIVTDDDRRNNTEEDIEKVIKIFQQQEEIFSRFNSESELSKLNSNLGEFQEVSGDIRYLAQRALGYYKESNGLFDPRIIENLELSGYDKDFKQVGAENNIEDLKKIEGILDKDLKIENEKVFFGRRMDFTGIAKGYIVDKASKYLQEKGWKNFLVDSGGDMHIEGRNKAGKKWVISFEGIPEDKLMVEISDSGLATSGITRKKWQMGDKKIHHLINPSNPDNFSFEIKSATVIADNTERADFLAKLLFLLGKEKGLEYCNQNKLAGAYLDYKGNIFLSPEMKKIST